VRVHFMRNVLSKVPKGSAEMVAAAIRTIFAQPDREAVAEQLVSIADKLGRQFPAVEAMLIEAAPDICAFARSPGATGGASGAPTRSSGSTARSSAGPT
jgi:putative transposase